MAKAKPKEDDGPDLFSAFGDSPIVEIPDLPASWLAVLAGEFQKPYFAQLQRYLVSERTAYRVLPKPEDVYAAFKLTPFDAVRVVLLGQDPYPTTGNAHGLCFSVLPGVGIPQSLRNIFTELRNDLGCIVPNNGYLAPWAKQGILMLNTVLTVRAGEPNSHQKQGWETFTDAVIQCVNAKSEPVIFVLWGAQAQKKMKSIDVTRHIVIPAAHPSPLSAKKFFGSKPFSKINAALRSLGHREIDWQLPNV